MLHSARVPRAGRSPWKQPLPLGPCHLFFKPPSPLPLHPLWDGVRGVGRGSRGWLRSSSGWCRRKAAREASLQSRRPDPEPPAQPRKGLSGKRRHPTPTELFDARRTQPTRETPDPERGEGVSERTWVAPGAWIASLRVAAHLWLRGENGAPQGAERGGVLEWAVALCPRAPEIGGAEGSGATGCRGRGIRSDSCSES